MFMYTVKKGDTLYGIAKKYNTTVEKIKDINYLTSNNLKIGDVIRIPETYFKEDEMIMPNYKNYIVKKGDTIYSIASNNGISPSTLIKDNGLQNNILSIGQSLKIRIPEQEEIEECFGEEYIPPSTINTLSYTVKKGDSLYSIANKYNTSVSSIKTLNNLTTNNLMIGQILKIPSTNNITYTVKAGDSLYSIAKKYNTTIDTIKKKNNLSTNLLSIGQKLII